MEDEVCTTGLSADMLRDCNENNVGGIEVNVVLINKNDIDYDASTFSAVNKMIMTNLKLKAGKTGYLLKGIKQINAVRDEIVIKDTSDNKFLHTFTGQVPNHSAESKARILELAGGNFVAVVEGKFKGIANKDAFQVAGFHSGLEISESVYASNENDGSRTFTLASLENYEEPKPLYTLLMTDYDTTKTAFVNKFEADAIGA